MDGREWVVGNGGCVRLRGDFEGEPGSLRDCSYTIALFHPHLPVIAYNTSSFGNDNFIVNADLEDPYTGLWVSGEYSIPLSKKSGILVDLARMMVTMMRRG